MRNNDRNGRRYFIRSTTIAGAGLLLGGCGKSDSDSQSAATARSTPSKPDPDTPLDVTATEDLMREHGILRRAMLVYTEMIPILRSNPGSLAPDSLARTATLFRTFGEDYHESKLEESFVFPAVKRAGGPAGELPDILTAQHERGRQVTDYILGVANSGKLGAGSAEPLARALESLVLMYRHHAAREDTIVFPLWKQTLSADQYDEMGDRFEEIEEQTFGEDGFEDAQRQIIDIEGSLGLADLARFTALPPPQV